MRLRYENDQRLICERPDVSEAIQQISAQSHPQEVASCRTLKRISVDPTGKRRPILLNVTDKETPRDLDR